MNERIKDLAEQAEKYADDNFKGEPTYSEVYDLKFAELIVKECVNVLEAEIGRLTEYGNSVDNENFKYDVDICVQKCIDNIMNLKEHFGVKNG